jgi:hypothetical protein
LSAHLFIHPFNTNVVLGIPIPPLACSTLVDVCRHSSRGVLSLEANGFVGTVLAYDTKAHTYSAKGSMERPRAPRTASSHFFPSPPQRGSKTSRQAGFITYSFSLPPQRGRDLDSKRND